MTEPIQRIRVYVLGRGDNPLSPPIDIGDPAILQAMQVLIDKDAQQPRLTPSPARIVRAVIRTGVANLQRVLGRGGLMVVADDGKLVATRASGPAQAMALANKVR